MSKKTNIKILGIDPGIGRIGWGLIEKNGSKISPIDYGCIETLAEEARLLSLKKRLTDIVKKNKPKMLVVEKIFFSRNVKTAIKVSEARGVILLCAQEYNLDVLEPTPMQVKQLITGFGHATKSDVAQNMARTLKIEKIPKPDDVADALAIALWGALLPKYNYLN